MRVALACANDKMMNRHWMCEVDQLGSSHGTRRGVVVSAKQRSSSSGTGFGVRNTPAQKREEATPVPQPAPEYAAPLTGTSQAAVDNPSDKEQLLPSVSKEQVAVACLQTSAVVTGVGFGLRYLTPLLLPTGKDEAVQALLHGEFLRC
jgi:hypothetical protein